MKTHVLACIGLLAFALQGLADPVHEKSAEPLTISHGAQVDLTDYLVPGKTTVFDFTSKFCPDCQAIAPKLETLHHQRADVAVVKVDINRSGIKRIDWQSPVALQYDLKEIPQFKIYGPNGKLISQGEDAYGTIERWTQ